MSVKIMKKAKLRSAKRGILFYDRISYGDAERRIVDVAERKDFDAGVWLIDEQRITSNDARVIKLVKKLYVVSKTRKMWHQSQIYPIGPTHSLLGRSSE